MTNQDDNTVPLQTDAESQEATAKSRSDISETMVQDPTSLKKAAELSCQDLQPPATIPGYAISRPLGEGAYGSVWLATERNTGKQVAVKFYSHRRGLDWSLLNREVEKLAVLYTSRNIVGLLDVGWNSDPPYYVMEFLENGSLSALLDDGALSIPESLRMTKSVLHALVHAHGSGILHCDLKPANVLLDTDFEPRICDFGQSRLSDEQSPALGTMFYMAPEQADLSAVPDARWDVYALGALLYHMLTGEAPYRTPGNEARIRRANGLEEKLAEYRRILRHDPKPSAHRSIRGIDRRLADIVDRCLQINPEKRFPNAQAVLDAIEERERQRARRPLMVLGVVFPIILLALLYPVANRAKNEAVGTATETLTERALESDVVSANIVAQNVHFDLQMRTDELVRITERPNVDLAKLLEQDVNARKNWKPADWDKKTRKQKDEFWEDSERRKIFAALDRARERSDKRREQQNLSTDLSWFITDAQGYQRWRNPIDAENTLDHLYDFRDYFHGDSKEYEKSDKPSGRKPIDKPHISLPFRSQSTGRFMVAISVPIRKKNKDGTLGPVVGVFARTMHIGEMLADYTAGLKQRSETDVARRVVLVDNMNGKLLDHPWMTPENLAELKQSDEDFKSLAISEDLRQRLLKLADSKAEANRLSKTAKSADAGQADKANPSRTTLTLRDYEDPVGKIELDSAEPFRGNWLAAFAPVGGTHWTIIVQERRSLAMEPIDKIENDLVNSGKWALGLFIGLIVIVWGVVMRRINDRPGRSSGRRGSGRGGTETMTSHTN